MKLHKTRDRVVPPQNPESGDCKRDQVAGLVSKCVKKKANNRNTPQHHRLAVRSIRLTQTRRLVQGNTARSDFVNFCFSLIRRLAAASLVAVSAAWATRD